VDLELDARRPEVPGQAAGVILLDTNALIWIDAGHARSRSLLQRGERLYVSPASVLELQFLHESGKVRLRNQTVQWVVNDDRWLVDEPPAGSWFLRAAEVGWTRDPFDRLLVAHAQVRRWRLATADARMLERLGPSASVEL
jgi:PIN domain nuclease of toxin-antitoxin system